MAKDGFPGGSGSKESVCSVGDLVGSLGQEDPQEKEMATHTSILAWEIPRTEEPGGLQCMVYEVATSQKQLGDQTTPRSMEKEV